MVELEEVISHGVAHVNGIDIHYVEAGAGPTVLLLHGFPESWYSWRHQIIALSEVGYHVVAPHQRGYGLTGGPDDVGSYNILELVGDIVGIVNHLGVTGPVVIGHDWGAAVAWSCAQFRPDLFRAVVGMSVPHRSRSWSPPLEILRKRLGDHFYQIYFQEEGPPEADLEADVRTSILKFLYAASGDFPTIWNPIRPNGKGLFDEIELPDPALSWLGPKDVDRFVSEFTESGFRRPLNWYRNIDYNWQITSAWQDAPILIPSLFISGDRDLIAPWLASGDIHARMLRYMPKLKAVEILKGCGHWTQQEEPQKVNRILIDFLAELDK